MKKFLYNLRHNRNLAIGTVMVLIVLLIGVGYSGAVELMQALFTDSRSAEWGDLLANTLGMGTTCLLSALVFWIREKCQK